MKVLFIYNARTPSDGSIQPQAVRIEHLSSARREESIMGDEISLSGNYSNVILNIKSTLTNVQQSVGAMPAVDEAARADLQSSIEQLKQALETIPGSLKDEAEAVATAAQMLVDTAKAEK